MKKNEESDSAIGQVEDKFRAKREAIRKNNPNNEQRLFRAIQWAKRGMRAEHMVERIILLWIAFNALYGREEHLASSQEEEHAASAMPFDAFLENIAAGDGDGLSAALLECRTDCESILDNQYVYRKYWLSMDNARGWKMAFCSDNERTRKAMDAGRAEAALKEIFRRVYVLRNQLMHGSSAFFPDEAYADRAAPAKADRQREDEDHPFNGTQVRAGDGILRTLIPVFIDAVIDLHKSNCWGDLSYPPQERPDKRTPRPERLR